MKTIFDAMAYDKTNLRTKTIQTTGIPMLAEHVHGFIRVHQGTFVDENCVPFYARGWNAWKARKGPAESTNLHGFPQTRSCDRILQRAPPNVLIT